MTIQNVIDNCGQQKRELDLLAAKFSEQDPEAEVNETGIALITAITDSVTAANQADATAYL